MTVGSRIKSVRGAMSQDDFAEAVGVSKAAIGGYERDKQMPGSAVIVSICKKFDIESNWLLMGKGPMKTSVGNNAFASDTAPTSGQPNELRAHNGTADEDFFDVPLVSEYPSAGTGTDILDEFEPRCHYAFPAKWLRKMGKPEDMLLMEVNGHSMEPEIKHGDLVMLDRGKTRPVTGRFFVVRLEGSLYVKRVEVLPRRLRLVSLDSSYTPIEVDMAQDYTDLVQIVGQVLWLGREMR